MTPISSESQRSADRAVFLGSKAFGLAILKSLVDAAPEVRWTILHPDDHKDARSETEAFEKYASSKDIILHKVSDRNEACDLLSGMAYDIGFVCGWYWLLDESIVGSEAPAMFGIHNSLLPKFRGGAPLVWSILRGEPKVGGTLFKLTPGMDDGDIVRQVSFKLLENQSIGQMLTLIEDAFISEIPEIWPLMISGQAPLTQQKHKDASYCAQRSPEDGLVNWNQTARTIHNFVRAQSDPYPCAFTVICGKKIFINETEVFEGTYYCRPGQVLLRNADRMLVGTGGNSALWILGAHDVNEERSLSQLFPANKRLLASTGQEAPA